VLCYGEHSHWSHILYKWPFSVFNNFYDIISLYIYLLFIFHGSFMPKTLFLASKSVSRGKLLQQAKIPYVLIHQDANEHSCDWTVKPKLLVKQLAELKMEHAQIPLGKEGDICFVL